MTWSLFWTDEARRDLARLDRAVAKRILLKLEAAAKDPHRILKRLKGADDYRLRVGDYRVLVLLASGDQRIVVQAVRHSSTIYRDRR